MKALFTAILQQFLKLVEFAKSVYYALLTLQTYCYLTSSLYTKGDFIFAGKVNIIFRVSSFSQNAQCTTINSSYSKRRVFHINKIEICP